MKCYTSAFRPTQVPDDDHSLANLYAEASKLALRESYDAPPPGFRPPSAGGAGGAGAARPGTAGFPGNTHRLQKCLHALGMHVRKGCLDNQSGSAQEVTQHPAVPFTCSEDESCVLISCTIPSPEAVAL